MMGGDRWRAVAAAALFAFCAAFAGNAAAQPVEDLQESPFVQHRLAPQLSDRAPEKQTLVLSVANQVMKYYGMDLVAIDVVTFGPGIDLLRADSPNRAMVDSVISAGVGFDICMNTVETVERETGRTVPVNPLVHRVSAAVPRLLYLVEHGYTLVRP